MKLYFRKGSVYTNHITN